MLARDLSDMELAVGVRAGDVGALGELYDRHVAGIYNFLARCTGGAAAVEDLAQATFLRAWEGQSGPRDPTKVRAWLYATARDLALVARRRARCERLAALVPEATRALTGPQRSAVDHHVRRCAVCRELGRQLVAPSEQWGALLPLPAALGDQGRQRLLATLPARPGPAGAPGQPRPPRRRWAGALALTVVVLLLLGAGGTAAYLARPAAPVAGERTPSPQVSQVADVTPTPTETPTPSPQPVVATPAATPTPRPTPTPTAPPLVVRTVTLSWDDQQGCPRVAQVFWCSFTATATVANPNGKDAVAGTLTITPGSGPPTMASTSIAPKAGQTLVYFKFQVPFRTNPCGTAVAATTAPNAVSSQRVGFGGC